MMNKIKYLVILLLTLVACSGTNSRTSEDVGEISLNLLNVPSEVQCLRITATNSVRTVERDIPLTTSTGGTGGVSNIADETPLQGLPTGDVTISANAYGVTCENVISTTIPTWKSYPMTQVVEIIEGIPYAWELVLRPNGYVEPSVGWQGDEVVVIPHVNEDVQNWLATQNSGWCSNSLNKHINICGNTQYCTSNPPMGTYINGISIDLGFYWDGTDTGWLLGAGGDNTNQLTMSLSAATNILHIYQSNSNIIDTNLLPGKHLLSYYSSSTNLQLFIDGILIINQINNNSLTLSTTQGPGFVLGSRMSEESPVTDALWLKFVPFFFHLRNTTSSWNFSNVITQQTSTVILLNSSTVNGSSWNNVAGSLNAYATNGLSWSSNFMTNCN